MAEKPGEHYSRDPEGYYEEVRLEKLPEEFHRLLEKFCSKVGEGEVLDAGCGPGRDTQYFSQEGFDVIGVDIAEQAIEYARENMEGEFEVMDISDLDFDDDTFDDVWCCASIFFVPKEEMKEIASEISRVVKPEGIAYFGFKIGEGINVKEEFGGEIRQDRVSVEDAKEMIESAGLKVDEYSVNEGKDG